MRVKPALLSVAMLAFAAGPLLAQAPATPARPAAPAAPAVTQPAAPAAQTRKININTATAAELDTLKGIGEARARKIIEERAKTRFRNFDDLAKRNILPANVEADIKDKISF